MASFAKVQLIGNLGRDPEMRYMPDGTAVCSFSVAVTEKRKGESHTDWWKVSVFGKSAEACQQYLHKGSQVFVDGRPRLNTYTDRDGSPRSSLECVANDVQFLGSKSEGQSSGNDDAAFANKQAASRAATQAQAPRAQERSHMRDIYPEGMTDSDIPF